ncbi:hypothetical protein L484_025157 [Morus notabilis]|uniref:Uncharacterized protein n=1 Tax=Morus notabilis TaxID=981085 RepID=W9RIZ5_9ROSA|nr:hypothetical protein L484_025157 [Morus notabilis]
MGKLKSGRMGGLGRSYSFNEGPPTQYSFPQSFLLSNTAGEGEVGVREKTPTPTVTSPSRAGAGGYR